MLVFVHSKCARNLECGNYNYNPDGELCQPMATNCDDGDLVNDFDSVYNRRVCK